VENPRRPQKVFINSFVVTFSNKEEAEMVLLVDLQLVESYPWHQHF
jgi:hypothetical protein